MIRNAVNVLFKDAKPVDEVIKFKEMFLDEFGEDWIRTFNNSGHWDVTLKLDKTKSNGLQYYLCIDKSGYWRLFRGERE